MPIVKDDTALLSGSYWGGIEVTGKPVFVTYSFPTTAMPENVDVVTADAMPTFAPLNPLAQADAQQALNAWSSVSGLHFIQVAPGEGEINFSMYDFTKIPGAQYAGGQGYYPSGDWSYASHPYFTDDAKNAGAVFFNSNFATDGVPDYGTILHEIGHALGFKHPTETVYSVDATHDQVLADSMDSEDYTIMSPNGSTDHLHALDIAAVQAVYGDTASKDTQVQSWSYDSVSETLTQHGFDTATVMRGISVHDSMTGGAGSDHIFSLEGDDTISGGAGNDSLFAGAGNDLVYGGADNDVIYGGDGNNTMSGGSGTDNFVIQPYSHPTTDIITDFTPAADPFGYYEKLDLSWFGSNLAITLKQVGADTSFVVGGNHTVVLDGVTATSLTLNDFWAVSSLSIDHSVSTVPTNGADSITGGTGNDTFDALGGNDTVLGLGGNDSLTGNLGNDLLLGGDNNDTVDGGAGADTMDGGAGIDLLSYAFSNAGISLNLKEGSVGSGGDATGDIVHNFENVTGSDYADTITGNALANLIHGGLGNDILNGGTDDANTPVDGVDTGNDVIYGDAGADTIDGKDGNDYIYGGTENDVIRGGTGNDTIYGGDGSDSLNGQAGDDYLAGQDSNGSNNTGNDTLYGGDGNDTVVGSGGMDSVNGEGGNDAVDGKDGDDKVFGGDGMDTVRGGIGNDSVYGGAGNDSLAGQDGDDKLYGQDGNDSIDGGEGNNLIYGDDSVTSAQPGDDTLIGGSWSDTIYGGLGNDRLTGKGGADILNGGAGNDVFVFLSGHSTATVKDVIQDFTPGQDKIDVSGIATIHHLSDLIVSQSGGVTHVSLGTGTSFAVDLTGNVTLHESDFVFAV